VLRCLYLKIQSSEYTTNAFDKTIKLNPKDAEAWNNKGLALKFLGHSAESDVAFAKARELGYKG
jgi:Flp pilus assembly protein TadD